MSSHDAAAHEDDELGNDVAQIANLLRADAAATPVMPNERVVRRQLLERIAEVPRNAPSGAARFASRTPRMRLAAIWRAHRVLAIATLVLCVTCSFAVADTTTPVGRSMRAAARAVNIPVRSEPISQERGAKLGDVGERPSAGAPQRNGDATRPDSSVRPGTPPKATQGADPARGELPFDPRGDGSATPPINGDGQPKPPCCGEDGSSQPPAGQQPKPPRDGDGMGPRPPIEGGVVGANPPPRPPADGAGPQPQPIPPPQY